MSSKFSQPMDDFSQLIKNTETACMLCEKDFEHKELIEVIKTDDDLKKQICILKLYKVENQSEADLLVFNITNHHGIIREAAALKINELMKNPQNCAFFQTKKISDTFLQAVVDMNPNICRLVMEILDTLEDKKYFFEKLFEQAMEIIEDARTMNRRKSGYIYSKKVFKIFWYLEAVSSLQFYADKQNIRKLIEKTHDFDDYTIREKCAKLLSLLDYAGEFSDIRQKLKNDDNYFVKRYF